jgi:hypothetical protein
MTSRGPPTLMLLSLVWTSVLMKTWTAILVEVRTAWHGGVGEQPSEGGHPGRMTVGGVGGIGEQRPRWPRRGAHRQEDGRGRKACDTFCFWLGSGRGTH